MLNHSRPTVAAWCENDAASASEQSTKPPEWVQSKELPQQPHRAVFPAFGQQISSYLLAQRPQCVQLLVVDLCPATHAGFADLPFRLGGKVRKQAVWALSVRNCEKFPNNFGTLRTE